MSWAVESRETGDVVGASGRPAPARRLAVDLVREHSLGALARQNPTPQAELACESAPPPASPRPRLLDRVRTALRLRHYSRRTGQAYVQWIRRFILFHGKRHPETLAAVEVTSFLSALAVESKVAASTQGQALPTLLFLYREVLEQELPWLDGIVRASAPPRLPTVLSRSEVETVLQRMTGVPRITAMLPYGGGLRLLECARLRVKDVDFERRQFVVRNGKWDRDRVTLLPATLAPELREHLGREEATAGAIAAPRTLPQSAIGSEPLAAYTDEARGVSRTARRDRERKPR